MTPLRLKMLDALMLRGMAIRTQEAYIDAVARLARHYGRSPDRLSAHEVQQYLLHLLRERHLARSSVNLYGCEYRFLYGTVLGLDGATFQIPLAPAPQRLPEILSREERCAPSAGGTSPTGAAPCLRPPSRRCATWGGTPRQTVAQAGARPAATPTPSSSNA